MRSNFTPFSSSAMAARCTNGQSSCNIGPTFNDPIIQAANLSVQHSFIVQHYEAGSPLGTLNVTANATFGYLTGLSPAATAAGQVPELKELRVGILPVAALNGDRM